MVNEAAERIYYDDPARLEFTATVTAIRELQRIGGVPVWQIALDRTAFYPTSGGQPFDTGMLTATARSGAVLQALITDVAEDDAGEVWHTTAKPLQEGTEVRGTVDAARRHDHMQQHTGQHLLSAVLLRDFAAATVSFHLGDVASTIDLDVPSLTDEQLRAAESAVNDAVAAALPLAIRYVSSEEAQTMLAAGLLRKLPPRAGRIRLIEIPGIDLNACGGTHVATTAAIGPVLLRGTERVRGGLRLGFVCGTRAIAAAREDFARLSALGQALSVGAGDIAESVARLQAESKSAAKDRAALLNSLAQIEAVQLSAASGEAGAGKDKGGVVIHTLDAQLPGRDAAYAKLLASRLIAETATTTALIVVPEGAPEPERASIVLAAKPGGVDCGTLLSTALADHEGRGGGNKEMAQGALPSSHLDSLLLRLQSELKAPAAV